MSFLVLDMETRVDKALVRATQKPDAIDDEAAFQQMRDELRQAQGSDFFPPTYHVPISIVLAWVGADYSIGRIEGLHPEDLGEDGIVRACWQRLEAFDGTLVTFNGRGFDLPVLELHALRHGIAAPRYFGESRGFRARYGRHLDLHDFLTNNGAVRLRGGLNLLARLIGLPGKTGIAGRDVQPLYDAGRLPESTAIAGAM